jgi:hypothetical protein
MGDARQTRASICRGAAARRLVSCTAHYLPCGIHASAEKLCSPRQHHLSRSKPNRAAESIFVCRRGHLNEMQARRLHAGRREARWARGMRSGRRCAYAADKCLNVALVAFDGGVEAGVAARF